MNTSRHRTGRKRGNNEGTITLRKDGRYEARVSLPGGKRKTFYGKTRAEAQTKLAAAVRDVQMGIPISTSRQTVAQYLTAWLEETAKGAVRPSTYRSYQMHVRVHIIPAIGTVKLTALTAQRVQHMLTIKRKEGASPRCVQMVREVLRNALNRAVKMRLVPFNAAADTAPVRVERKEVRALTPDDAQRVLAAVEGDTLEALYVLALATGCRQAELLGFTWSDVDMDAATITVCQQLQRVEGAWALAELKSARSRRTLAVDPFVIDELREHRVRQLEARLVAGGRWQETIPDLVFRNTVGNPCDGVSTTHRLQRLLARAGLPRMRFHDLRHGAASLMLAQDVPARVVMEQLGHSQISLTLNTYSHVAPALQREAAARLGAALNRKRVQ